MTHLKLLHHFLTETCLGILGQPAQLERYRGMAAKHAFSHEFLMSEMLALAALHLSITIPDTQQREWYRDLSVALMDRALREFNEKLPTMNADNCVTFVMFAHVVGLHSFRSAMLARESSIGALLPKLTQTVNLMRGLNPIMRPWMPVLMQEEFGDMIRDAENLPQSATDVGGLTETFSRLLEQAEMRDGTRELYMKAVKHLQENLNYIGHDSGSEDSTFAVFAWWVNMPRELVDHLEERRPEALALLAWYAVVLHRHRGSWVIGDSGKYMFGLIEQHLGARWEDWIAWPKQTLSLSER
ncbi:hypothetical protein ANO11243_071170 [Dothideomycetidae sp. 11243]|nr:hypothetical protein ANO11243_071170 [fungal sp. No.11243]